jgi:hypothetical protein
MPACHTVRSIQYQDGWMIIKNDHKNSGPTDVHVAVGLYYTEAYVASKGSPRAAADDMAILCILMLLIQRTPYSYRRGASRVRKRDA